jgi:hypothetical protein
MVQRGAWKMDRSASSEAESFRTYRSACSASLAMYTRLSLSMMAASF